MDKETEKFYKIFCKKTQSKNGMWEQRFYTDCKLAPAWGYQVDETASVVYGVYEHYLTTKNEKFLKDTLPMCEKAISFLKHYVKDWLNLDEEEGLNKDKVKEEMEEQLKKQGKTIIFVTHSINDVLNNCNRTIIMSEGKKIFDGGVKEGVERYKKLIAGMLEKEETEDNKEKTENKTSILGINDDKLEWKKYFTVNPDVIQYGNKEAEIVDFGMFNYKGEPSAIIDSQEEITVKLKAKFNKDVECPTFSMTIKDFSGKEICGTNTNFLNYYTGKCEKGKEYICEFKQRFQLAPGKYTLSLSCSRYDYNGEIVVLNRNYDLMIFEVMSTKKFVGYYDINTEAYFSEID